MEIRETDFSRIAGFLYTSKKGNKYLIVDKNLEKSKRDKFRKEAEKKDFISGINKKI